jgi:aspartyl protease family protein
MILPKGSRTDPAGRKAMVIKEVAVLAVATLSALAAGGGVMQFGAQAMAPVSHQSPAVQGRVLKAADGHYWATADVDGKPVRFLVDTGSSAVTLSRPDAARLGFDATKLTYDRPVFTASGPAKAAAVTLDHIDIAGARVDHVTALVIRGAMTTSLLGMSYLGRLSRLEATPEALVLTR